TASSTPRSGWTLNNSKFRIQNSKLAGAKETKGNAAELTFKIAFSRRARTESRRSRPEKRT
ncbi:MAG: hypothetical protein K2I43_06260, partial [Alistipes sp.]|nr:hypothetical protein [Alistipes sp.]